MRTSQNPGQLKPQIWNKVWNNYQTTSVCTNIRIFILGSLAGGVLLAQLRLRSRNRLGKLYERLFCRTSTSFEVMSSTVVMTSTYV